MNHIKEDRFLIGFAVAVLAAITTVAVGVIGAVVWVIKRVS